MNLRDLLNLNNRVIAVIEGNNPTANYNELISQLGTMRTSPTPELQKTINERIANIEEQNDTIEQELDVIPHISFLDKNTDLRDAFGTGATNKLTSLISTDPYFAPTSIAEMVTEIANYLAFLKDANKSLGQYGIELDEEEPALVSFELQGESDISTTSELRYRLSEIEDILHAFARLDGQPEAFAKPQVYSLSKSSPVIIDIGGVVDGLRNEITLLMLAKAITWIMSRIEQAQKIQLNHQQLKKKDMINDEIEVGFKKLEAEPLSKEATQAFIDEELIADEVANVVDGAGANEEIRTALAEAMKKLTKLLQKGATANIYIPQNVTSDEPEVAVRLEKATDFTQQTAQLKKTIFIQDNQLKQLKSGEVEDEEVAEE